MNALYTILLLLASNVFMTLAWYGHRHTADFRHSPLVGNSFLRILSPSARKPHGV